MLKAVRRTITEAVSSNEPRPSSKKGKGGSETVKSSVSDGTDGSVVSHGSSASSGSSEAGSTRRFKPSYVREINCTERVPVSEITYRMVMDVMDSWEQGIKQIPAWDKVTGAAFTRKIFELDPDTIKMFGFPENSNHDDPALFEDRASMLKSIRLIKAVDIAVGCLGPDLSPLETQLVELGERHAVMNCRPYHWPIVGEALMHVFDTFLKDKLTPEVKESWIIIYNFLSYHMIRGLLRKKPSLAGTAPLKEDQDSPIHTSPAPAGPSNTTGLDCTKRTPAEDIDYATVSLVVDSFERNIKTLPDWKNKTGVLLMRYMFKHCGTEGKKLLGYSKRIKWDDPRLSDNPKFVATGARLMAAFDMAVSFLGPDLSELESVLTDLGRRHFHMSVKPHQWPLVGEALFDVFRDCMGDNGEKFTVEVQEAWAIVYNFLGYHMIQGLLAEKNGN